MTTGEIAFLALVFAGFAAFIVGLAIATTGARGPAAPGPDEHRSN